jgi:hypothetical protein
MKCPPQPAWAGDPPEPEKLLVELLMQPQLESTRNGTGIRIYEDGRVFAYDEVYYEKKDGKMTNRRIPGKWRQHKTVPAARVAELRTLLESEARDGLIEWQGKGRKERGKASHLNVRVKGEALRSCYKGIEGGEGQKRVDALTKKIMGEAYSDEVNRNG